MMNLYRSLFLIILLFNVCLFAKEGSMDLSSNPFLSFEKTAKKIEKSIVTIETQSLSKANGRKRLGNGVVIDDAGYIATSNDLLLGLHRVTIKIHGKKNHYIADVIGRDIKSDIALLKIREDVIVEKADFAESSKTKTGDIVFAVGGLADETLSMTHGIISHKKDFLLYTDAPLGHENFGGALVDYSGSLIGINSALFSTESPKKSAALSSDFVKNKAKKLIEEYKIINAYFGMILDDLESRYFGLYGTDRGALVVSVEHNKSADNSGLKRGDLILSIEKEQVKDKSAFASLLASQGYENNVTLGFVRDRFTKTAELKPSQVNKNLLNTDFFSYAGMTLENISKERRARRKLPEYITGVFVSELKEDSPANKAGMEQGDIIIQIDGNVVSDIKSFADSVGKKEKERIFIYRNGWNFIKLLEGEK